MDIIFLLFAIWLNLCISSLNSGRSKWQFGGISGMVCVHLSSKFRWWRILFPGVQDLWFLCFFPCCWSDFSLLFLFYQHCFNIELLALGLRWIGCPESAVGMLLRHCALWQSGCRRLLLKHQHSSVMISVTKKEREHLIKVCFTVTRVWNLFRHREWKSIIHLEAIRGRCLCREQTSEQHWRLTK